VAPPPPPPPPPTSPTTTTTASLASLLQLRDDMAARTPLLLRQAPPGGVSLPPLPPQLAQPPRSGRWASRAALVCAVLTLPVMWCSVGLFRVGFTPGIVVVFASIGLGFVGSIEVMKRCENACGTVLCLRGALWRCCCCHRCPMRLRDELEDARPPLLAAALRGCTAQEAMDELMALHPHPFRQCCRRPYKHRRDRAVCMRMLAEHVAAASAGGVLPAEAWAHLAAVSVQERNMPACEWVSTHSPDVARAAVWHTGALAEALQDCSPDFVVWHLARGGVAALRVAGTTSVLNALAAVVRRPDVHRGRVFAALLPRVSLRPNGSLLRLAAGQERYRGECCPWVRVDEHAGTWAGWLQSLVDTEPLDASADCASPLTQLLDRFGPAASDDIAIADCTPAALHVLCARDATWLHRAQLSRGEGCPRLRSLLDGNGGALVVRYHSKLLATIAAVRPKVMMTRCAVDLATTHMGLHGIASRLHVVEPAHRRRVADLAGESHTTPAQQVVDALTDGMTGLLVGPASEPALEVLEALDRVPWCPAVYSLLSAHLDERDARDAGGGVIVAALVLSLPTDLAHRPSHERSTPWPLNLMLALIAAPLPPLQVKAAQAAARTSLGGCCAGFNRELSAALVALVEGGGVWMWMRGVGAGAWSRRRAAVVKVVADQQSRW
jgi:hypothetical protein